MFIISLIFTRCRISSALSIQYINVLFFLILRPKAGANVILFFITKKIIS